MKMKTGRKIWMIAAVCMLMMAAALPVSAQTKWEKEGYAQITVPTAMRTAPGDKSAASIVRILPSGAVVSILSAEDDDWYKVSYGRRTGYVEDAYFTEEDDEDFDDDAVYRVLAISMPLRSSPKYLTTNIVTSISALKQVEILGERSDNWVHVAYDDSLAGYIPNGFFVTDTGNAKNYAYKVAAENIYIRSTRSYSNDNVVATLKAGSKIKVTASNGNWYRVTYNGVARFVKAGFFTVDTKYSYVTETIASSINFREKADINSTAIRVLSPGTTVKVYKEVGKRWYKIKYGSKTGYVIGGYFTSDKKQSNIVSGDKRVTTAALCMRKGNGTEYSIITVIPAGSIVTLVSKNDNWYMVRYSDTTDTYVGWVSGSYLDTIDEVE